MPNRNYVKGRRKEYHIRKKLLENGFDIAQRTAGSHSPIDVFAIHKREKIIVLVQAKPDSFSDKETKKLEKEYKWLDGMFQVYFFVE